MHLVICQEFLVFSESTNIVLTVKKKSKDKYGDAPTWYDEDILKHAHELKIEIQRIEDFDYAYRYGY